MFDIEEVESAELYSWLSKDNVVLIDVREEEEYKEMSIPGSHHMPLSCFDPEKVPYESEKKLVFYCRSGRRSYEAALLWKEHFPDRRPFNLQHGIIGWYGGGNDVDCSKSIN